jgi:hypothetical protein
LVNFLKYFFRNCKTTLRDCVPVLGNFKALKAQFDWIVDGEVSHLVKKNLGSELRNLEMYLR